MKWISVRDRLPQDQSTVIVLKESFKTHDYVCHALYVAKDNAFYWQDGSKIENVEYWRQNCFIIDD